MSSRMKVLFSRTCIYLHNPLSKYITIHETRESRTDNNYKWLEVGRLCIRANHLDSKPLPRDFQETSKKIKDLIWYNLSKLSSQLSTWTDYKTPMRVSSLSELSFLDNCPHQSGTFQPLLWIHLRKELLISKSWYHPRITFQLWIGTGTRKSFYRDDLSSALSPYR